MSMDMCLVPSVVNRNKEGWRHLVKEFIAKISNKVHFLKIYLIFFRVCNFLWFLGSVFLNPPNMYSGGVSRKRYVAVAIGNGEMWQVTCDR